MKILISAYTGLGNFVLKTPMIRKLRALYPDAVIDIIAGNSYGAEHLLKNSNLINQTHILPPHASFSKKSRFFWQLRKYHYDILLLPFDASPNFLILGSYLANIKKRIKHFMATDKHGWLRRLTLFRKFIFYPNTIFIPVIQGRHEIDLNYDLLEAYLNRPIQRDYKTLVHYPENNNVLQQFNLTSNQYIILQTAAANGNFKVKAWPNRNFIALIERLLQKYDYPIVLVGDKGDYEASIYRIHNHFKDCSQVVNTAGETSISDLIQLIAHAKLIVCHDSGVMHIADAFSKSLIALYGPTDYTRTRPMKESSHILFSKTPYFAAMYNFKKTEAELSQAGIGHAAMEGILVDEVVTATATILAKKKIIVEIK